VSIVIETRQNGRFVKEQLPLDHAGIAEALSKLDGDRTSVFTMTVSGNHLLVGAGAGKYTVTTMMVDGRSLALVGDQVASGKVRTVIGGQLSDQPVRYLVDADRVLRACRYFAREGEMDDQDQWEEP
jgi:hypothetical protein